MITFRFPYIIATGRVMSKNPQQHEPRILIVSICYIIMRKDSNPFLKLVLNLMNPKLFMRKRSFMQFTKDLLHIGCSNWFPNILPYHTLIIKFTQHVLHTLYQAVYFLRGNWKTITATHCKQIQ